MSRGISELSLATGLPTNYFYNEKYEAVNSGVADNASLLGYYAV